MEKQLHRYPGVTPFSEQQQNIFFGRTKDIQNLKSLILVRNQVLLYAKSGVGKTSLLNAGILPIIAEKYTSIQIRFTAYTSDNRITPIQNVINKFKGEKNEKTTILDTLIENTDYKKSLWFYLKQAQLLGKEKIYILVFDQFEELFTYPAEQISEFKEQLSQIIQTESPDEILELIFKKSELEEHQDIDDLYNEIKVKVVYAIRSDKLNLLNHLSDKISNIQRDYYELQPLTSEQARQAIINPANKINKEFIANSFEFKNQAIDRIIEALSSKENQNIETTQLQIVCQRIEEIVLKEQNSTLNKNSIIITQDDLPKFKDIFFNFYENAVNQTDEIENTYIFIEDQLIRNGKRISLDKRICQDYIGDKTLDKLTYSHLLRSEPNSTGGVNYELSHDTLVEPILISRKERKIIEAEKKTQEKNEKEKIKLLKEQKRQRNIIFIISIATIVSLGFGIFGFVKMKATEVNLKIANIEKKKAEKEKEKTTKAKIEIENTLNMLLKEQAAKKILIINQMFQKRESYITAGFIAKANKVLQSIEKKNIGTGIDSIRIANKIKKLKGK